MKEEKTRTLDYWRMLNSSTAEYESVAAIGAWKEADEWPPDNAR